MSKNKSVTAPEGNSDEEGADGGPTMSESGATPNGSEMSGWTTAYARPDATRRGTMPSTKSTPMPGEKNHEQRNAV